MYISIGGEVVLRVEEILSFVYLDLEHDRKKYNNERMLQKAAERGELFDLAAEAGRREHANRTRQHRRLIAQNIPEHVGGNDNIEPFRVLDHPHTRRVDMVVLAPDIFVVSLAHFVERAFP